MENKKLIKLIATISLYVAGALITGEGYATVNCADKACLFSNLTKEEDQNHFFCDFAGKPSLILFRNHHVLIAGFSPDGTLELNLPKIPLLTKYYFDAKKDKTAEGRVDITVVGRGDISCKEGTGGRREKWPGPYGE